METELEPLISEPVYTVRQSAKLTGLQVWTIRDQIKTEKIMKTKIAGKVFIRRSELMKLIVETAPKPKRRGAK